MSALRIAVVGATGRTGSSVVRVAAADDMCAVIAALAAADDPQLGQDAGLVAGCGALNLPISSELNDKVDVLIDFSTPQSTVTWAEWCQTHGVALVSGTTGLDTTQQTTLAGAAERVPVLAAPNMSLGVNLLIQLVGEVASKLGPDWDIEISETHHRQKVDAPSGTANALYQAICAALNLSPDAAGVHGRQGQVGPRRPGEIGMHALRMGGIVGEHSVHFATPAEVVTLEHRAFSRDTFAAGAVRAAKWLCGRPAGRYHMRDVLFGDGVA